MLTVSLPYVMIVLGWVRSVGWSPASPTHHPHPPAPAEFKGRFHNFTKVLKVKLGVCKSENFTSLAANEGVIYTSFRKASLFCYQWVVKAVVVVVIVKANIVVVQLVAIVEIQLVAGVLVELKSVCSCSCWIVGDTSICCCLKLEHSPTTSIGFHQKN